MFDFNASLNDVAPVFPILLSVDVMINKTKKCLWMSFVCLSFFVFTTQIELNECCV